MSFLKELQNTSFQLILSVPTAVLVQKTCNNNLPFIETISGFYYKKCKVSFEILCFHIPVIQSCIYALKNDCRLEYMKKKMEKKRNI